MEDQVEYYCDECNSKNVILRPKPVEKNIVKKPMSQMSHPSNDHYVPAVYIIEQYEAYCQDCKTSIDIPHPNQWQQTFGDQAVITEPLQPLYHDGTGQAPPTPLTENTCDMNTMRVDGQAGDDLENRGEAQC